MKRILVAGAAGFTGFAVCDLLNDRYEVRGIDLNPMPHLADSIAQRLGSVRSAGATDAGDIR